MRSTIKWIGISCSWVLFLQTNAFAQAASGLVTSFNNLLIGVSALLVAVSFVFVMVKVAHLIELISARYEARDSASKSTKR